MKSKEAKTWAEIRNQATDNIMGHFALLRKVTILRTEFVSTPLTRKVESHLPHLPQFPTFLLLTSQCRKKLQRWRLEFQAQNKRCIQEGTSRLHSAACSRGKNCSGLTVRLGQLHYQTSLFTWIRSWHDWLFSIFTQVQAKGWMVTENPPRCAIQARKLFD